MKKFINSSLKYLGAIFLLSIIALAASGSISAAGIPEKFKDFNPDNPSERLNKDAGIECQWNNTSSVRCSPPGGSDLKATYSLDLVSSKSAGHLVFAVDFGNDFDQATAIADYGFVHFSGNSFNDAFITTSPTDPTGGNEVTNVNQDQVALTLQPERTDRANICSLSNFKAGCVNGYVQNATNFVALGQADIDKVKAVYDEMVKNAEALNACDNSNAPLPFIFCPILNGITSAIGGLIGGVGEVTDAGGRKGLLISFLELPPISTNDPNGALNIVVGTVITVANSLYIIIFLLLIFSSSIPFLNLDSYTIKKTLPKFIGAVILTQFALPICAIIVDFFNIIALAIPNVLFALTKGLANASTTTTVFSSTQGQVVGGIGATLAAGGLIAGGVAAVASVGWILILILAIAALVAAFIAIIYLLIRYFILYILIIISPLAFAAWVLPGTEKFFKMWWKNFIKLNAMFVTIMALLSGSIVISAIISKLPGAANGALIASIIPIIALLLVPKTLKWTTQGMNALATGALNAVGGAGSKAAGYGKGQISKSKEEGKNRLANVDNVFGRTASAGFGGLLNTKASQRQRAARASKYANERNAEVQFDYNKSNAALQTELAAIDSNGTLTDPQKKAAKKKATLDSARALVGRTAKDATSRQALMVAAAQSGDTATLRALQASMTEQEWATGVANNYAAFDGVSQYRAYDSSYKQNNSIDIEQSGVGTGTATAVSGLKGGDLTKLSGQAQKDILAQSASGAAVPLQSFIDAHADTTGRAKVSQELRADAYARAQANPTAAESIALKKVIDSNGNWIT